tara:strand:+ start:5106 stop:5600 length:495 start_codon:yes stop_codon:yes gene_type:complete
MEYPKKISNNITFREATKSRKAMSLGLENLPNEDQLSNMILVAENVFQPLREHYGWSIAITSFFRAKEVNEAVGGAKYSAHMKGQAIDIDADVIEQEFPDGCEFTNKMIFDWIVENCEFDTIIWEYGTSENPAWVHVSYVEGNNRKRKLRVARDRSGKSHYSNY